MSIKAVEKAYKLSGLKLGPKSTLIALCESYNQKTGQCNPSQRKLAEKTGASIRTVSNHLKVLEKLGLISKTPGLRKNGGNSSCHYTLNFHGGEKNLHTGAEKNAEGPNEEISEPLNEPEVSDPEVKPNTELVNEKFECFWNDWLPFEMIKGSKKLAMQHFERLLKKGECYEEIRNGCERYLRYCHDAGCKTKHVSTWLKQEGWRDEYEKPQTHTKQTPNKRSKNISMDEIINAARQA